MSPASSTDGWLKNIRQNAFSTRCFEQRSKMYHSCTFFPLVFSGGAVIIFPDVRHYNPAMTELLIPVSFHLITQPNEKKKKLHNFVFFNMLKMPDPVLLLPSAESLCGARLYISQKRKACFHKRNMMLKKCLRKSVFNTNSSWSR